MKNIQRIDEAVGSITERRASAESLLKMVAQGSSKDVEGIKLSKEMADAFLDWLRGSTYGRKFGALPFYKLFSASFNWGLDRYTKSAALKKEYKELKARASEMRKAEKFESLKALDEAIDLLKSSWKGTKGWNDVARVMDAGLKKAIKIGSVDIRYAKDYIKSLERMAKRNAKKFFDEYGNFTEEDFIEDVEYNMANENKVISEELKGHAKKMKEDGISDEEIKKMHPEVTDEDLNEAILGPTYLQDVRELIMDFGDEFEPSEIIKGAKSMEKELMKTVKLAIKDLVDYKKDELEESLNEGKEDKIAKEYDAGTISRLDMDDFQNAKEIEKLSSKFNYIINAMHVSNNDQDWDSFMTALKKDRIKFAKIQDTVDGDEQILF